MPVETLDSSYMLLRPATHGLYGDVKAAFGVYDFGVVALDATDTRRLFKLPKCIAIEGHMWAGELDTGANTADIDIGWAANGAGAATYAYPEGISFTNAAATANTAGFVNSAPFTEAAIANLVAAGINYRPFPFINGPLYFAAVTTVQATVVAAQATPAAGKVYVCVKYVLL